MVTYDPLYGWTNDGYIVTSNPLPCVKTFAMNTYVGDSIVVSGVLDAYAEAYSGIGSTDPYSDPRLYNQWLAGGDAYADFSHTGSINLQAPAGFSFTTDSGASYAPVPLPATVWLFGSGLLGLIGVARKKK